MGLTRQSVLGAKAWGVVEMTPNWNAYPAFRYAIVYDRISYQQSVRDFSQALAWCWDTFDASIDLQSWQALKKSDPVNTSWSWDTQTNVHPNRIYFASTKEVDTFILKWN